MRVDIRAIEQQALGCTKCRLAESRTQVVWADGNLDAKLMFVGEAPGRNEDLQGRPFVGAAGQLLDRLLGEIGIGTNFGIKGFSGEILLDEKIGGTVHLAVGAAYPESGGVNDSAVHWDMVCDLRKGGRITVDGDVFMEDGKLLIS